MEERRGAGRKVIGKFDLLDRDWGAAKTTLENVNLKREQRKNRGKGAMVLIRGENNKDPCTQGARDVRVQELLCHNINTKCPMPPYLLTKSKVPISTLW